MRRPENPSIIRQAAFQELLSSDFQKSFFPVEPVHQVAPNPHINIYRMSAPEGMLFIKHYHKGMHIADEEFSNYQYLKNLPFIPKLVDRVVQFDKKTALFAYEYIEGRDTYEEFTDRKMKGMPIGIDIAVKAINQFYDMDSALRKSDFEPTEQPWALRSPVRKGFLEASEEQAFLQDYQASFERNQQSLDIFPGYYFDRNPRNIMYTNGELMEVDYNVIEFASPLFDLAKFLRNGTDVPLPPHIDFNNIDEHKHHAPELNVYTSQQEDEILRNAYSSQTKADEEPGSFEDFKLLFQHAAVHAHIFYLTKYVKMYKEGGGEADNLFSRSFYHYGMLEKTLATLEEAGEPVGNLFSWTKRFISLENTQ